jgi:hypothetical protein
MTSQEIAVEINVTVNGLEAIDLGTVVNTEAYYDHETDERIPAQRTLADVIADKVTRKLTAESYYGDLKRRVTAIRDEEIREAIEPIITEAISGEIQKTNSFGEPTGKSTTIRELIMSEARTLLTKSADSYGRGSETVLQKWVREQIAAAFTKELAAVVAQEKEKVVAAVRAKAADLIADAVKQGVGR